MTQLILEIPDRWWVTSNDRPHWAVKAKAVAYVRKLTWAAAKGRRLPRHKAVHITVFVQYPTGGRADPNNAEPMGKAAVDGLVDAGVIPDDDDRHVLGPDYRREVGKCPRGVHRLRLVITDQEARF